MTDNRRPPPGRHHSGGHSTGAKPSGATRVVLSVVVGCLIASIGLIFAINDPDEPSTPSVTATQRSSISPLQPPPAPMTAPASPAPPPADSLRVSFDELTASLDGEIGIALAPAGGGPGQTFGTWTSGPAWSTSKVPVVMAALREQGSISSDMNAAITESDNAAAEAVWASLGDPGTAKAKVEQVLTDGGDPTSVQAARVRPEYTAFGQTTWSLANQATFLAKASCDGRADPVLGLMGQVEPGQSWGLGRLTGARFKGGWGPSESGAYLVRQFGVIPTDRGSVAIAIATEPTSGSFGDGTGELDTIADWISDHIAELPAGTCQG